MNEYKRAYFIGAAETASRIAGDLFYTFPTRSEKSIKLAYCYLLAANGQIKEAREYLLNESPDTKAAFESILEQAEQLA